ncbi:MAG: hypoxanthine phosphoribosyltransferase [Bacteroidales bacterium]|nr:hypoxanthine phosphoribosyltransferase [Bacteroidales bacterium]
MEKIKLFDKCFRPYIPYERLSEAIDRVAAQINADFKDADDVPVLLCILNGSVMFTSELMKRLEFPLELVSMKLTSYSGTVSTGDVHRVLGPTADLRGRRVIVVEDIVDTGNTIVALRDYMKEVGARGMKICTMLLKPDIYKKDVQLDYVGLEIPPAFIVGFGLDYNGIGRNSKDIYVLDESAE